jgi:aryl-alcohol dehydrogenase-like predicted oxidoreductase
MSNTDRRGFLRAAVSGAALGAGAMAPRATAAEAAAKVDRRTLGRTGAPVSIYGLGLGSAFLGAYVDDFDSADALLRRAVDVHGINYWDTASSYSAKNKAGKVIFSQELVGRTVPAVRDKVFLVTKSGNRTYDGFKRDVENSLKLLKTDRIDLYHMHNLDPKVDLDAMERGCVKAARELKEQGVIKHYGVTGHTNAACLIAAIKRFDPDCVMTTFPAGRPDQGRFEDELLPLAVERKMGAIAMKVFRQARAADIKGVDLIRYALSLKGICVAIAGIDSVPHLDDNAKMAAGFKPLERAERAALNARVQVALADETAPWLRPGYRDGVLV